MVEFRGAPHTVRPAEIIEIYVDGVFKGALYPFGSDGVRLISAHLAAEPEKELDWPAAWRFKFRSDEESKA